MLTRGTASARALSRARTLDLLHRGRQPADVAAASQVSRQTAYSVRRRDAGGGLQAALFDQPRPGRPAGISGRQRAGITALACSTPPEGRARWALRLLAGKAVEWGYCESLSHAAARAILKKAAPART